MDKLEFGKVLVVDHIKIIDSETKEIILDQRGNKTKPLSELIKKDDSNV